MRPNDLSIASHVQNSVPTRYKNQKNVIAPECLGLSFKPSRENVVPNKLEQARVEQTAKTRRPQPRSNQDDRVTPSVLRVVATKNKEFLGTVRFENDHVAVILGFGDLQWGNILITRVYFVEGLGHNLFSVGQFCDSDLEVAFRRNSCFVRNLDGVDLLKGNRSTNLYTINLHEMASASPICLMARATSTKSCKRASHPPKPVPNSKQRLHLLHMDLCGPMRIASINGKRYVLVIVDDYSRTLVHLSSSVETIRHRISNNQVLKEYFDSRCASLTKIFYPNSTSTNWSRLERRKSDRALRVAARRSMIEFSLVAPLFYRGVKSIALLRATLKTAPSFTVDLTKHHTSSLTAENRISPFYMYSASVIRDMFVKDLGSLVQKVILAFSLVIAADACAYTVQDSLLTYAPSTITTQKPTEGELDLLFEAMYDDYIGGQPSSAPRTAPAAQAPQDVDELETQQHGQHQPATIADNVQNAMFDENTFVNPFATPSTSDAESSSSHKFHYDADHQAIVYMCKEGSIWVIKQAPTGMIFTGHRFSPNKTSAVYKKTSPRSDLRWKPTGRIFKTIGLRWVPTRKILASCTSKDDSEPTHGSNVDIPNIHEYKQTVDSSAGTSINVQNEQSFDLSAGHGVLRSRVLRWKHGLVLITLLSVILGVVCHMIMDSGVYLGNWSYYEFLESIASILVKTDDPNITMEEYIRLEEEKACRRGKVFNWETDKYGKIWYDKDVQDLRSIETEFPAIVFDDAFTSEVTPSYEPTVIPLNDNKIDFRISFDESDDKDYTVIYDENSFSFKIIFVNDLKTNSKNDNDKVNMPSFPSLEPTVSYFDDLDFFKDFEKKFPAIVYNDALTSKSDFLTETTVSPQHIDEFDLKDETSLSEYTDNDNDKIDIEQPSGDMSVIPSPNVINIDAQWSNKLFETSHDTSNKFFKTETFVKELDCNVVTCNFFKKGMPFVFLIKNLYVPFGIPFDPKLFYKDGIKLGQV
ncbi:retrovirus-related pol polyprotein from transposon TNT 1-94 [Tanacetum coccineum]